MVAMVSIMLCVFYHQEKFFKKLVRKFKHEALESFFSLMKMALVPEAKICLAFDLKSKAKKKKICLAFDLKEL